MQRECRFYTAGCVNQMAFSGTEPRAVNELGGPGIPGIHLQLDLYIQFVELYRRLTEDTVLFFLVKMRYQLLCYFDCFVQIISTVSADRPITAKHAAISSKDRQNVLQKMLFKLLTKYICIH